MPTPTSSPITLLSLSLDTGSSLVLSVSPWLLGAFVLGCLAIVAIRWKIGRWRAPTFEINAAEMGFGSGKISFRPNVKDQEIAYKIWVELSTRKIGLPIDLKNDVVVEVYDSWHTFFAITRELIKDIPVNRVKHASTRKIITLSIQVLNDGLRPHLTSWQARFRHWYEKQLSCAVDDIDPQSLQATYPRFAELEKELLAVNGSLIRYREKMKELVLGLSDESVTVPPSSSKEPSL
jgi:hypothetical protein